MENGDQRIGEIKGMYRTGMMEIPGECLAEELRIDAIPTFIINGKLVSGALPQQQLESLVQEALAEQLLVYGGH